MVRGIYNNFDYSALVDPCFIENRMDYQFALRFFPFRQDVNMKPKKVREQLYSYFDGAFIVHTIGFKEFLQAQLAGAD